MKAKLFSLQLPIFFLIISSFLSTNLLGFAPPANDDMEVVELSDLYSSNSLSCEVTINDIAVTTCNNEDNTYDLTVDFSVTGLSVGDSLYMHIQSSGEFTGVRITDNTENYTIVAEGLPSTGLKSSFALIKLTPGCLEFFHEIYTAPVQCVLPPPNDDCLDAIEVLDLVSCNLIHASTYGASLTSDNTSCNSNTVDVWYKFTANTNSIDIKSIEVTSYGEYEVLFEFFKGPCSNLIKPANNCYYLCEYNPEACEIIVNNLIIGEVYYIRIFAKGLEEADFCVQAVDNNICNDQALNLNMATTNQATYQTQQTITAEGIIPSTDNTSFIAEQIITLMPGFHVQAGAEFHAYIEDCTPSNPFVEIPAEERTTAKVTPIAPLVQDLSVAPNPFQYSTTLKYNLEKATSVNLRIYSMSGQLVKELVTQEIQPQGNYEYIFEPKQDLGNFYFAVMITPEQIITKKMIFIR